jgi:hypothetical protein
MRPVTIGLFVAVLAAALFPAASALAAAKVQIDPDRRAAGMKAAPGAITAAGVDCQLANAYAMGEADDDKTHVHSVFTEVACKGGEGFILATHSGGKTPPDIFTCIEAEGMAGNLKCVLPENADPSAGLAPFATAADPACVLDKARGIGHSVEGAQTYFEVACKDGAGYLVVTSYPISIAKPVKADPCMAYADNTQIKCTLTDATAQAAWVDKLAAQSGKPCVVKDRRYVGASKDGELYFEVACQDGKGYILGQAPNDTFKEATDCAFVDLCKLTDARAAESAQSDLYTKLSHAAGFECTVVKYAAFNVNLPGHEVVELSCSNRPDGAVGIFPAAETEKAQILPCARSELDGYRCGLSPQESTYPLLTSDLKALGKTSCTVSSSRVVGVGADNDGYIEVGCADGNPGFMIEYSTNPATPKKPIPCSFAGGIGGGCKLPGNAKPKT